MKTTILAVLIYCAVSLQSFSANVPLIPAPLNALLPRIRAGMTIHEVEEVLSASYPKVAGRMSLWDGMTGYIDYKLDERYTLSVASINRMDGQKVIQVVGGGDLFFCVFDRQTKHRIEIKLYDWEKHGTTNLITTGDVPAEELAVQCPVVVYARAETNNAPRLRFVVTEVWKGAAEASRAGITNGIELPAKWLSNGGPFPEGAIVFYQRNSSAALQLRSEWMVRDGRVGGMDTNKFKTKCLLGSK